MNGTSNDLVRIVLIMNIVLVVAVCVLVGKDFFGGSPKEAYAAGGAALGKYIAVPVQFAANREALVVIDTQNDSMIAYALDQQGDVIYTAAGRTMDQEFKLLQKLPENFFLNVGPLNKNFWPAGIRTRLAAEKTPGEKP